MENKKVNSRLLFEDDVIKAVDRHTNEDGTLDDDISCILEEVNEVKTMRNTTKEEMKSIDDYIKSISKPTGVNFIDYIQNKEVISTVTPKVFIFKTHEKNFMKVQEYLKECIQEGCLVIPDDVEFVGIEEPYKERRVEY